MTPPSREEVFETIISQLQEHRIITFKWLSRTLKIHSALAREYLEEWVKKSPKDQYIISYTVFGRKGNGELLLMLTTEITDDHFSSKKITVVKKNVYSIRLLNASFEPSFIYNVDKSSYESQQMSLSSINYHTEIIRKNLEAVRKSATLHGTNRLQNNIGRASPRKKKIDLMKEDDICRTSPPKNGIIKRDGFCETSPKKNVFEKDSQTILSNQSTKDLSRIKQVSSKKSKKNKPVVAITNFFGRNSATKDVKNVSNGTTAENLNEMKENSDTHVKAENIDNPVVDDIGEEKSEKESATTTNKKNRKSDQESLMKKTKKTKKKGKQLKRILTLLDSDSDENSTGSDVSINVNDLLTTEPEPIEVEESESEPRVIAVGGKKRKRKVIEEEGEEDGFMVTTRKVILESCDSEDESEVFPIEEKSAQSIPIKSGPPEKKPKTEVQTKKKQSSILNFFQKP